MKLTLLCSPGSTGDPTISAYEAGQLSIEWHVPAACGFDNPEKGGEKEEGEKRRVGSGLSWFFLV